MGTTDLEARLRALPAMAHPGSPRDVRVEAGRRRWRRRRIAAGAAVTLAAAAIAVVVLTPSTDTRWRGGPALAPLGIQAVAEGPLGPRPLADGARLAADEAVVFRVFTGAPGTLALQTSAGDSIWPAPGTTWEVGVGEHFVGGGQPLAWTPDGDASGPHQVVATWCPEADAPPADCARATFAVQWTR